MLCDRRIRVHERGGWNEYKGAWWKLDVDSKIPQDQVPSFCMVEFAQGLDGA